MKKGSEGDTSRVLVLIFIVVACLIMCLIAVIFLIIDFNTMDSTLQEDIKPPYEQFELLNGDDQNEGEYRLYVYQYEDEGNKKGIYILDSNKNYVDVMNATYVGKDEKFVYLDAIVVSYEDKHHLKIFTP